MEVRKATLEDVHWIAQEMKIFADEYISDIPLYHSDEYIINLIENIITNHVCYVAEDDTGLVGVVAGLVNKHIYNPDITQLIELVWWVPKDKRGTGAGKALLDAYTAWGKKYAHWTVFSHAPNTPVGEEIFLKKGYKLLERNYFIERSL